MDKLDLKNYKNRHSLKSKIVRLIWNATWLLLARWTPDRFDIFSRWRILLLRLFGAKIGHHCGIRSTCEVWQPWNLEMKDYASLGDYVVCYTVDRITIGSQAVVSREAFLCCASHDITSPVMELTHAPIEIGANAWIAARAIVMPGRRVGDGAVVAAGAVVTRNVEPWTIVGGNPAKPIGVRKINRE